MLVYYFIYTSTPGWHSPKIWHTKIHVKCFEQTHASIFPVKSHIMRIRRHFDATMLIYKYFAVFFNTIHTKKYTIATCVKQKMATSDEDSAHSSAIQVCFPSGLTPIDTFCQSKSTELFKNVSRTLAYTWHDRFSDSSTDNTSRGHPMYKNCRIIKFTPDVIDCD